MMIVEIYECWKNSSRKNVGATQDINEPCIVEFEKKEWNDKEERHQDDLTYI